MGVDKPTSDVDRALAGLASKRRALAGGNVDQQRIDRNINALTTETQRKRGKVRAAPVQVTATNWRSKSYKEMKSLKDSISSRIGEIDTISTKWGELGQHWADKLEAYDKAVKKITADSWTGETASMASASVTGFVGDFPDSVREYANSMQQRMAGLAANFRLVDSSFPTIEGSTSAHGVEFTDESLDKLSGHYDNDKVSDWWYGWRWGDFHGDGYEWAGGTKFADLKAVVDRVYTATATAARLLADNYSNPLVQSVQNVGELKPTGQPPTGGNPDGTQRGPGGNGGGGNGGGGNGGGGRSPVGKPDIDKAVKDALNRQNVDKPSNTNNPFEQVANTAGNALSSLGTQAQQGIQQALSQAQQAAQQAAAKEAVKVTPTPHGVNNTAANRKVTPAGVNKPDGGAGGGKGGGGTGGGTPERPAERTTRTGSTQKASTTTDRPTAGIAQTAQGAAGPGAGAPGAGGRGGGGSDKVHKVLKALRTRVNGEAVAGIDDGSVSEAVVESVAGGREATGDGSRT